MRAILTYHSIDASGSVISVAPAVFAEHVRWLSAGHVRVLPLPDLIARDPSAAGDAVAITFDDGFENVEMASRQLADHGLSATVFVVTNHAGKTNAWGGRDDPGVPTLPLLDWDRLATLGTGASIGAHTRTHAKLTTLSSHAIEDELDGCVEALRAHLGVTAAYLAYPYGDVDDRVAAIAGPRFTGAVTTAFRPLSPDDDRTRLPRLDMYYFRQSGAIERWGTRRFAARLRAIRLRRRVRTALT